jgi:hypothetical protein
MSISEDFTPSKISRYDYSEIDKSVSIISSHIQDKKKKPPKKIKSQSGKNLKANQTEDGANGINAIFIDNVDEEVVTKEEYNTVLNEFKAEMDILGINSEHSSKVENTKGPNIFNHSLGILLTNSSNIMRSESNKPFQSLNYFLNNNNSGNINNPNNNNPHINNISSSNANIPIPFLNIPSKETYEKVKKKITSFKTTNNDTCKINSTADSIMKNICSYSKIDLNSSSLFELFEQINYLYNDHSKYFNDSRKGNDIVSRNKNNNLFTDDDFELRCRNWNDISTTGEDINNINNINNNTSPMLQNNKRKRNNIVIDTISSDNYIPTDDKKEKFSYQNILLRKIKKNNNLKTLFKDKEMFRALVYLANKNLKSAYYSKLFNYLGCYKIDEDFESTIKKHISVCESINARDYRTKTRFSCKMLKELNDKFHNTYDIVNSNTTITKKEIKQIIKIFCVSKDNEFKSVKKILNKNENIDYRKIWFVFKLLLQLQLVNNSKPIVSDTQIWKLLKEYECTDSNIKKEIEEVPVNKHTNVSESSLIKKEIIATNDEMITSKFKIKKNILSNKNLPNNLTLVKESKFFIIPTNKINNKIEMAEKNININSNTKSNSKSNIIKIDTSNLTEFIEMEAQKFKIKNETHNNTILNPNNTNSASSNFSPKIENLNKNISQNTTTNVNLNLNLNVNLNWNFQMKETNSNHNHNPNHSSDGGIFFKNNNYTLKNNNVDELDDQQLKNISRKKRGRPKLFEKKEFLNELDFNNKQKFNSVIKIEVNTPKPEIKVVAEEFDKDRTITTESSEDEEKEKKKKNNFPCLDKNNNPNKSFFCNIDNTLNNNEDKTISSSSNSDSKNKNKKNSNISFNTNSIVQSISNNLMNKKEKSKQIIFGITKNKGRAKQKKESLSNQELITESEIIKKDYINNNNNNLEIKHEEGYPSKFDSIDVDMDMDEVKKLKKDLKIIKHKEEINYDSIVKEFNHTNFNNFNNLNNFIVYPPKKKDSNFSINSKFSFKSESAKSKILKKLKELQRVHNIDFEIERSSIMGNLHLTEQVKEQNNLRWINRVESSPTLKFFQSYYDKEE